VASDSIGVHQFHPHPLTLQTAEKVPWMLRSTSQLCLGDTRLCRCEQVNIWAKDGNLLHSLQPSMIAICSCIMSISSSFLVCNGGPTARTKLATANLSHLSIAETLWGSSWSGLRGNMGGESVRGISICVCDSEMSYSRNSRAYEPNSCGLYCFAMRDFPKGTRERRVLTSLTSAVDNWRLSPL
jgi:hypothetical protein